MYLCYGFMYLLFIVIYYIDYVFKRQTINAVLLSFFLNNGARLLHYCADKYGRTGGQMKHFLHIGMCSKT